MNSKINTQYASDLYHLLTRTYRDLFWGKLGFQYVESELSKTAQQVILDRDWLAKKEALYASLLSYGNLYQNDKGFLTNGPTILLTNYRICYELLLDLTGRFCKLYGWKNFRLAKSEWQEHFADLFNRIQKGNSENSIDQRATMQLLALCAMNLRPLNRKFWSGHSLSDIFKLESKNETLGYLAEDKGISRPIFEKRLKKWKKNHLELRSDLDRAFSQLIATGKIGIEPYLKLSNLPEVKLHRSK